MPQCFLKSSAAEALSESVDMLVRVKSGNTGTEMPLKNDIDLQFIIEFVSVCESHTVSGHIKEQVKCECPK